MLTREEILAGLLEAMLRDVAKHPDRSQGIVNAYAKALNRLITRCSGAVAAFDVLGEGDNDSTKH